MKNSFRQFFLFLLTPAFLVSCSDTADVNKEKEPVKVTVMKPLEKDFTEIISTQGVIEAVNKAVVSAQVPGKIELLTVKEGDRIKKGQLLFRIDGENLKNAVVLAKDAVTIAEERVKTRQADLDLAKLGYDKSLIDYNRNTSLIKTGAVSSDVFEKAELSYNKSKLTIEQAQAALSTAQAEVSFTKAALNIAEKKLADSESFAPYDGFVTSKLKNENEFCGEGTPVLKIEQPDHKRISVIITGLHYQKIKPEKTHLEVSFAGKVFANVPVSIVANTIDPVSRTFELKGDLPADTVIPSGTLCDVKIITETRKSFAVPEGAVMFRSNGKFAVYAVVDGKAKEIEVIPGITEKAFTEILSPASIKDLDVVTSGQYFTNDGDAVTVAAGEEK